MKDIEHILRVAATFLAVIILFLIVRSRLTPESYGKIGHYRAAAVDEIKALPIRYAGQKECAACHKQQVSEKAGSSHRTISCESCHGPLRAHVEDPGAEKPRKPADAEVRAFCGVCHEKNGSRPAWFHQVNLFQHNPDLACTQCHSPHKPKL